MTVYFDNAATTKVCKPAIDGMVRVMEEAYGNPASTHARGREAKKLLDTAREQVASAIGALPEEIFFTSGGTEGDNWAILGVAEARQHQGKHLITTAVEHDAVRKPMAYLEQKGFRVTYLQPDASGRVSLSAVEAALQPDTILVSMMLVNNETGAKNPVPEVAKLLRPKGILLHTDAVQAFCKIPFTVKQLGADLITLSSHKIHGPKGAGALYIRKGVRVPSRMLGGGQERGFRSGTEAMPAFVGFGIAAAAGIKALPETERHLWELRNYLAASLSEKIPGIQFLGEAGAPHILSLSLPGYRSEVLLNYLDAQGICVARSSACKKGGRSHVLEAMQLPAKVIDGAIRVSFSGENTLEEASYFAEKLAEAQKVLYPALP